MRLWRSGGAQRFVRRTREVRRTHAVTPRDTGKRILRIIVMRAGRSRRLSLCHQRYATTARSLRAPRSSCLGCGATSLSFGDIECRQSIRIFRIQVGAALDQQRDEPIPARSRSAVQGSLTVVARSVDVRARGDQFGRNDSGRFPLSETVPRVSAGVEPTPAAAINGVMRREFGRFGNAPD